MNMRGLTCFTVVLLMVPAIFGWDYVQGQGGKKCQCNCGCEPEVIISEGCDTCGDGDDKPTHSPMTRPQPTPTTMFHCYPPFKEFAGGCYYFMDSPNTQGHHKDMCADYNSKLAHVGSAQEFDDLVDFIQSKGGDEADMYWIQGMWMDGVGEFKDDHGEVLFDGFSDAGIVVNIGSGGDSCIMMYETCAKIVEWQDCSESHKAICETGPGAYY